MGGDRGGSLQVSFDSPRKSASQKRTTTSSHAQPACDGTPEGMLRLCAPVRAIWGTPFQQPLAANSQELELAALLLRIVIVPQLAMLQFWLLHLNR